MVTQTRRTQRSFAASGPAEAGTVARLRDAVGDWVAGVVPVDDERRADILLATDEALSNCADHAYGDRSDGAMSIELNFDRAAGKLVVQVSDRGAWVDPTPRKATALRGRGIVLMRALADDVTIDGRGDGTTVRLRFADCRRPARIAS